MDEYKVIGVMSGTSLDGLDIAYCTFASGENWAFRIVDAITVNYPQGWTKTLRRIMKADGEELARTDAELGRYIGEQINLFIRQKACQPDFIASHGHTVFHQPERHFTRQIGDGNAIAAITGLPVIYDFRSLDVALGGQGAPLVPVGDRLLFGNYGSCLNLGGIANISFEKDGERKAFDICPANMFLDHLASKLGHAYDCDGKIASGGVVDEMLLGRLNELPYYRQSGSKTLGREWFEHQLLPLIEDSVLSPADLMRTATEHIANQVARSVDGQRDETMLVTGGGALNTFLIRRISALVPLEVVVPDERLVQFKEALVFALLGVLRFRNEVNCLASVTGASRDSCCGVMVK